MVEKRIVAIGVQVGIGPNTKANRRKEKEKLNNQHRTALSTGAEHFYCSILPSDNVYNRFRPKRTRNGRSYWQEMAGNGRSRTAFHCVATDTLFVSSLHLLV